jgi:hypothetical protein
VARPTAAPPRLEPSEQRDHHDPVTLAAAREVEDELEQHPLQIDADEDDRRREARRLRIMAGASSGGARRNRAATAEATRIAREGLGLGFGRA